MKNAKLLREVGGLWKLVTNTFGASAEKGIATAFRLATAPDAASASGKLWHGAKEIPPKGLAADAAARRRLWDESGPLANL